jgi:hypothetical protein
VPILKGNVKRLSKVSITFNPLGLKVDLPYRMVSIIPIFSSLGMGKQIGVRPKLSLEKKSPTTVD